MKRINDGGFFIRPFTTYKSHNINYYHLSGSSDIRIDEATEFNSHTFSLPLADKNPTGIYKQLLGKSINNLFLNTSSMAFPLNLLDKNAIDIELPCYVLNIPQQVYGEEIKPGSLVIDIGTPIKFVDNGNSKLIVSGSNPELVVGQIFYKLGIALIKENFSGSFGAVGGYLLENYFPDSFFSQYFGNMSGSSSSSFEELGFLGMGLFPNSHLNIAFNSTYTIYESIAVCTMEPLEFNYSSNPTVRSQVLSGSNSASTYVPVLGDYANNLMADGTLNPYFTTIGLYNDSLELLAIGKVPRAIKRLPTSQQTVIVKIDI